MTKSRNSKTKAESQKPIEYECPFEALHDYVIIEMVERKLESDIIIPEGVSLGDRAAIVVGAGEDCPESTKALIGKPVIYAQWRKNQMATDPRNGKEYMILNWEDLAVRITDDVVAMHYSKGEAPQRQSAIARPQMLPPKSALIKG